MSKKPPPSQPASDSAGLAAAMRQAEAEIETVTRWMGGEGSSSMSAAKTKTSKGPPPRSGGGRVDSGPETLNVAARIRNKITDGEITNRRQLRTGIVGVLLRLIA